MNMPVNESLSAPASPTDFMNQIELCKGLGYLRRSDLNQKDNNSFEMQKQAMLAKAKEENIQIVAWVEDDGVSAFRKSADKRRGLLEIFDYVRNGIECILFYEESRIDRSITSFFINIYTPLKDDFPHLSFYSTKMEGEWDPRNPMVQARFVFAHEESVTKSKRAKDSQHAILHAEKANRPGSRVPLGFNMEDGILYPNEDMTIVQLIFHLYSWGYAEKQIAEFLVQHAVYTKLITSWNQSTIHYILHNEVYLGHLSWNKRDSSSLNYSTTNEPVLFKNFHEPIISLSLWQLCLQMNSLKKTYGHKFDTPFYLKGKAMCTTCTETLQGKDQTPSKSKQPYLYYFCPVCRKKVKADQLNALVLKHLTEKWLFTLSTMTEKRKAILTKAKKSTIQQLKDLKEKQQLIQANLQMQSLSPNQDDVYFYQLASTELQKDISNLSARLEEIEQLLDERYDLLLMQEIRKQPLSCFSRVELRTLVLLLIDQVKVTFSHETKVVLDYRLTPFIELDTFQD